MEIKYRVTETGIKTLRKFPWLKSNYPLRDLGSYDDREITRLLENPHYPHILKTLEQIDKYGSVSGEIAEGILKCNDNMSFSRLLVELNLFVHLHEKLGSKVSPIERIHNQKTPDISVKLHRLEALIEIYSPMDYYGYQTFSRLLTSCIKNLPIAQGFNLFIDSEAENLSYTYNFPEFRQVLEWLDRFREELLSWLTTAKVGEILDVGSPAASSLKLKVHLKALEKNREIRRISWGEATRSTDTRLYFEIDDPSAFAETDWGVKVKDKLQRQQAGKPRDNLVRILAVNFALADTSDVSFLNEAKYHANLEADIQYLASDIEPYPPYDIVLPCQLGLECGFAKPINLSNRTNSFVNEFLNATHLDSPIQGIPNASEEEMKALWDSIKNVQEYENSEVGNTPNEWEVVKLQAVSTNLIGGGTPSTAHPEFWGGDIPWMTSASLTNRFITKGMKYITEQGVRKSTTNIVPENALLVSTRVGIGKIGITRIPIAISQDLTGIVVDLTKVDTEYLYWSLLGQASYLKQLSQGSTVKGLTREYLRGIDLRLPRSLPEQRKIAEVLSTVDDAIQKVDHAIEKTQRHKKGLMQKLLTRGIGHSEFKETEIGRIPKEWAVVRLGNESIARIRGNRTINGFEKVAFIPMESVPNSNTLVEYEVRPRKDVRSFTYCKRGDLLLAKITPSLENGKQGIVPDKVPNGFALATTEVFPISCTGIEKLFLFYLLKFPKFRNRIISSMTGTTGRQRASKKSVENLEIPLPPLPEQRKIAEILGTVDKRLKVLSRKKQKLERVKRGLMNDLLTGKRRVRL